MNEEVFTTVLRVMLLLASILMSWWAIKSFVVRCKLKICEFADFSLVVVAMYWFMYSLWSLLASASIMNVESLLVWTFNMRFGLLLTIIAFSSLIKDRLLVSSMYEALMIVKEKNGQEETANEPERT